MKRIYFEGQSLRFWSGKPRLGSLTALNTNDAGCLNASVVGYS